MGEAGRYAQRRACGQAAAPRLERRCPQQVDSADLCPGSAAAPCTPLASLHPLAPCALEVRPGLQGPGTTHSCRGAPQRLGPGGSMAAAAWRQHGARPSACAEADRSASPSPSGTDPASGRTYWFNEATKESRWEAP